jgi:3-hydroxybutyryl-CoA dehydrogenase
MEPAQVIGVAGAGTMGAGIAQLAARSGARTLLHDPDPAALERGLARLRERGADAEPAHGLAALAGCELVIEAAPEDLALKRELFRAIAAATGPDCVLATNTSSLSVTAIAAGVPGPERVVGMHFFNPAPVMRLLEVVAGDASSERALALARATGEAMGRHVVDATDGPGFLVNRCNRPFSLEALRIVQERLATPEQVDRICRMGGGFRMGPFELMDLVGLDVGLEVARSLHAQSFGEPRWRPSPLVARLVAAGRLGRKAGRGWFEHPHESRDPDPPEPGGEGLVVVAGETPLAFELLEAAAQAGWDAATPAEAAGEVPDLIVDCGATEDDPPLQGAPQVILCDSGSLAGLDPGGSAAGFFCVPPLGRLVELTRGPGTSDAAAQGAERFFGALGMHPEWVGDAPGLVLGRIAGQLVNEACFALGEGVGDAGAIDAGMVLGLNHPRGPLEWGDAIGPGAVLAIVVGLQEEYREERYRPAPALVRAVREETELRPTLDA